MYWNSSKIRLTGDDEGSRTNYRLQTVWRTPAAIDLVWGALANYVTWPTWWRGIENVEVLRRGEESGAGTVPRQWWRSRVPCTLVFDLEMLRIDAGGCLTVMRAVTWRAPAAGHLTRSMAGPISASTSTCEPAGGR